MVLALRSIKNFAKIAAPLTNLLKKSAGTYEWDGACDEAFETLKDILVKVPVLSYLTLTKILRSTPMPMDECRYLWITREMG